MSLDINLSRVQAQYFFFFEVHDAQKHQDIGWINIFQIINNVSILY